MPHGLFLGIEAPIMMPSGIDIFLFSFSQAAMQFTVCSDVLAAAAQLEGPLQ